MMAIAVPSIQNMKLYEGADTLIRSLLDFSPAEYGFLDFKDWLPNPSQGLDAVLPLMKPVRMVGRCRLKPGETRVESAWYQRSKLKCDGVHSSLVFSFKLCRYSMGGAVVKGYGRGSKTLGIPTANLDVAPLKVETDG